MQAAHARGLRVITELVANHTSDQHPWFQAARRSKPGSPARDFYVWSDTDQRYAGTPIISRDVETSNWTWDPMAGPTTGIAFWRGQPDFNYANPLVLERDAAAHCAFWLDLGVDGFRLDAIPYLCEREGTDNAKYAGDAHHPLRPCVVSWTSTMRIACCWPIGPPDASEHPDVFWGG